MFEEISQTMFEVVKVSLNLCNEELNTFASFSFTIDISFCFLFWFSKKEIQTIGLFVESISKYHLSLADN